MLSEKMRKNAKKNVLILKLKRIENEERKFRSFFYARRWNMTKRWWKCAGIRALKTICQTAIATIGTSVVLSDVDWIAVVSASVLAGVLSMLTSLAGLPEVESEE